jgi:hypothetical protein
MRGGVFVNYRVIDNPLGAAGIHNALVTRFGAERVFRDCVSVEPGDHYPTTIREALDAADVLVAIIGPDWLALTDETTGERLIDRENDWVRQELLWAHERTIPVVPVLLVNTPENAIRLRPDELPTDLRWFGYLQAFEFSQARFGADVDRLATRLVVLAPRLNGHTDPGVDFRPLSSAAFAELVAALEAVPSMASDATRSLVVTNMMPSIAGAIPHYPQRRLHVIAILRTCLDYDGGITNLLSTLASFEAGSAPFERLCVTASRLLNGAF